MQVVPMAVDLSHWDPADDYDAVKADGIAGVIYKATEGDNYTDPTYVGQQQMAKQAGLKWGAYHFANAENITKQIDNFMRFACPDPDELFCLDWEDYGSNTMSLSNVKTWMQEVERQLGRDCQCVLYSGNTAKEALGDSVDTFMGDRRLWLCQYGSTPSWQKSWDEPWLWQFTDGVYGPSTHSIDGIGPCDINSYNLGPKSQFIDEWATGIVEPAPEPEPPPGPVSGTVNIIVAAPPGITVRIRQLQATRSSPRVRRHKESGAQ